MFIDDTESELTAIPIDQQVEDTARSENEKAPPSGTELPALETLDLASGPFINLRSSNL